eukprot:2224690-Rhodomonas_salina.2
MEMPEGHKAELGTADVVIDGKRECSAVTLIMTGAWQDVKRFMEQLLDEVGCARLPSGGWMVQVSSFSSHCSQRHNLRIPTQTSSVVSINCLVSWLLSPRSGTQTHAYLFSVGFRKFEPRRVRIQGPGMRYDLS